MSEDNKSGQGKSGSKILIPVVIAGLAMTGIMFMQTAKKKPVAPPPQQAASQEQAAAPAANDNTEGAELSEADQAALDAQEATAAQIPAAPVDLEKAMAERSIGDANAPVTITEYASLTCPHCAHFHNESFAKLKAEYIDTGKVRFISVDFPLNAPAMDAVTVARCLPADKYFDFTGFLFETQDKWAYDQSYRAYLRQNAKLLGLDDAAFNGCVNSEDLKKSVAATQQAAAEQYKIQSTPSFVIDGSVVTGASSYEDFKKLIDMKLNGETPEVPVETPQMESPTPVENPAAETPATESAPEAAPTVPAKDEDE